MCLCEGQGISENLFQDLKSLVSACALSYCDIKTGDKFDTCSSFCDSGLSLDVVQVVRSDTRGPNGYIAVDHSLKQVLVVFRGSNNNVDWLTNFEIAPAFYKPYLSLTQDVSWSCADCLIHKGFYRTFQKFMDSPFNTVMGLLESNPQYQLVITGHSLGGAYALLTALEFQLIGKHPLLVTFGQPKLSITYTFANMIDQVFETTRVRNDLINNGNLERGYYRVVHNGDRVPHLPPGYISAGVEIYIKKKELPHEIQDIEITDPSLSNDLLKNRELDKLEESAEPNKLLLSKVQSDESDINKEAKTPTKIDDIQPIEVVEDIRDLFAKGHREYFKRISGCHE